MHGIFKPRYIVIHILFKIDNYLTIRKYLDITILRRIIYENS